MSRDNIQLVCFDIGGVLIRICDSWSSALCRADVEVNDEINCLAAVAQDAVIKRFDTGKIDSNGFCRRAGDLLGIPAKQVEKVVQAWLIEPFQGVEGLISRLKQTNVSIAYLSNTNEHHWEMVTNGTGLDIPLDQIDHIFLSYKIGYTKPDEHIYQHVEKKTGFAGCSILFFDDSRENLTSASQRGWQTFCVDPTKNPVDQITEHLEKLGVL